MLEGLSLAGWTGLSLFLFSCPLSFSNITKGIECYQEQESESGDGVGLGLL